MQFITIIKNLFIKTSSKPLPLGRWKVETCNIKVNNKIDLSNEDHCGPCGEYEIINKNPIKLLKNNNKLKKIINNK
jgi:hypothetical protein